MLSAGPRAEQQSLAVTTAPPPPASDPGEGARSRARADLVWYLRHADALARWPVLPEPWARAIERRRLEPGIDERSGTIPPPEA